jgi:phosphopantothenoylcysteine decarboxylase / phosphopantothenate---cysteine ligase
MSWDLGPPPPSALHDRAVASQGDALAGRRVALMVTGGIAAMRAPMTARALRKQGASVVAFASPQALRYVGEEALSWATTAPVVTRLSAQAEHLSDAAPFDAYLVAPATYNTLNKFALGIADNPLLATLASALGRSERGDAALLVAPTMHGSMHNRILIENLQRLRELGVHVIRPKQEDGKDKLPDDAALIAAVVSALAALDAG